MIYKTQYFYCLLSICFANTQAWLLEGLFRRFNKGQKDNVNVLAEYKEHCDENQLLLPLARLYVTSPERIILLVTSKSLKKSCKNIGDVLGRINITLNNCEPLPSNNLYMKLYDALNYYNKVICQEDAKAKGIYITNYHDCLRELREDIIECEGPPDWFEKSNEAVVCQYYNDIINCNYVKAALLCGLKAALMLRNFSSEIVKRVVPFKCKVSENLPHVDNPMPSRCPHYKNVFVIIWIEMLLVMIMFYLL